MARAKSPHELNEPSAATEDSASAFKQQIKVFFATIIQNKQPQDEEIKTLILKLSQEEIKKYSEALQRLQALKFAAKHIKCCSGDNYRLNTLFALLKDIDFLSLLITPRDQVAYSQFKPDGSHTEVKGLGIFNPEDIKRILHNVTFEDIGIGLNILRNNLDQILTLVLPKDMTAYNPYSENNITGRGIFTGENLSLILIKKKKDDIAPIINSLIKNIDVLVLLVTIQTVTTIIEGERREDILNILFPADKLATYLSSILYTKNLNTVDRILETLLSNRDNILTLTLPRDTKFITQDGTTRTALGFLEINDHSSLSVLLKDSFPSPLLKNTIAVVINFREKQVSDYGMDGIMRYIHTNRASLSQKQQKQYERPKETTAVDNFTSNVAQFLAIEDQGKIEEVRIFLKQLYFQGFISQYIDALTKFRELGFTAQNISSIAKNGKKVETLFILLDNVDLLRLLIMKKEQVAYSQFKPDGSQTEVKGLRIFTRKELTNILAQGDFTRIINNLAQTVKFLTLKNVSYQNIKFAISGERNRNRIIAETKPEELSTFLQTIADSFQAAADEPVRMDYSGYNTSQEVLNQFNFNDFGYPILDLGECDIDLSPLKQDFAREILFYLQPTKCTEESVFSNLGSKILDIATLNKYQNAFNRLKALNFNVCDIKEPTSFGKDSALSYVIGVLFSLLDNIDFLSLLTTPRDKVAYSQANSDVSQTEVNGLGIFKPSDIVSIISHEEDIRTTLARIYNNINGILQLLSPRGENVYNPLSGSFITGEGIFESQHLALILKKNPDAIPYIVANIDNLRVLLQNNTLKLENPEKQEIPYRIFFPANLATYIKTIDPKEIPLKLQQLVNNMDNLIALTLKTNIPFVDKDNHLRKPYSIYNAEDLIVLLKRHNAFDVDRLLKTIVNALDHISKYNVNNKDKRQFFDNNIEGIYNAENLEDFLQRNSQTLVQQDAAPDKRPSDYIEGDPKRARADLPSDDLSPPPSTSFMDSAAPPIEEKLPSYELESSFLGNLEIFPGLF